jgi:hypothetical protein
MLGEPLRLVSRTLLEAGTGGGLTVAWIGAWNCAYIQCLAMRSAASLRIRRAVEARSSDAGMFPSWILGGSAVQFVLYVCNCLEMDRVIVNEP